MARTALNPRNLKLSRSIGNTSHASALTHRLHVPAATGREHTRNAENRKAADTTWLP